MPGIASGLYKQVATDHVESALLIQSSALFRRNVVFLTTVFAGAFAFEIANLTFSGEELTDGQRQWKDIRHKYVQSEEDEDE
ncbi:MAG: hypothetical protein Q9169_001898 [Polycauliona sp. 2 TL-2023]